MTQLLRTGKQLKLARVARDMTQDTLANMVLSHRVTILNYEAMEQLPDTRLTHMLSTVLLGGNATITDEGELHVSLPDDSPEPATE